MLVTLLYLPTLQVTAAKTLYDIIYELDVADVFHSKWLNCAKDVFTTCGNNNCWRNQSP